MSTLVQALCVVSVLISIGLALVGLPGTVLIVLTAGVYGLATHFTAFSPWFLLLLFALSAFAEIADNLIGAYWAKRSGSSWRGVAGSIVGALVGAMIGSGVAPILGTIVGGLAGSFLGAFVVEYHRLQDTAPAARAGWGAFAGRTAGIALKLVVTLVMAALFLARVF